MPLSRLPKVRFKQPDSCPSGRPRCRTPKSWCSILRWEVRDRSRGTATVILRTSASEHRRSFLILANAPCGQTWPSTRSQFQARRRTLSSGMCSNRLKLAYFQLAASQHIISVLAKNHQVADQIEQGAEARYRVGEGTQQDVLRAQLERTKLLNEFSMQRRESAQAQVVLKALLNRPAESADLIPELLSARNIPGYDALIAKLREKNPELQVSAEQVSQKRAAVELAKREKKPDFGVQYMWQHTADNFRDYYMGTFSIKLPNRSRVRAAEGESQATLAQAEAEKESRRKQMESDLGEQLAIVQTSEQQLKVYEEGLIPQSEAALNAGLAGYRAGKQEYQGLLASFSDTLQLAIERERALAEHESAIARIEGLIGV